MSNVSEVANVVIGGGILGWAGWVSGSLIVLLRKTTRIETLLLNGKKKKSAR